VIIRWPLEHELLFRRHGLELFAQSGLDKLGPACLDTFNRGGFVFVAPFGAGGLREPFSDLSALAAEILWQLLAEPSLMSFSLKMSLHVSSTNAPSRRHDQTLFLKYSPCFETGRTP
jgi:hypothetical protein